MADQGSAAHRYLAGSGGSSADQYYTFRRHCREQQYSDDCDRAGRLTGAQAVVCKLIESFASKPETNLASQGPGFSYRCYGIGMMLKELGRTGVRIPEVGMGTHDYHGGSWPLRRGLESGALFIDTAESYGTEAVVGQAVRGIRERVFIATKVSPEHLRPTDLRRSVDASLLRLGVDRIDLLQLHQPNPAISIEETMGALGELVDVGKIRFCGVSNFSVDQLRDAQKVLRRHAVVSNQVRFNLIDRTIETGLLQYCQAERITVIAYSPLARSLGRIMDCDPYGTIRGIARANGKSAAQIAINWCLCRDGVVAIPKSGSQEHVVENCNASDWRLSAEQIALLDATIQYRHRNWFDQFARQSMPRPLQDMAARVVRFLPRSLRRRVL